MSNYFTVFKKYSTIAQAQETIDFLTKNGIKSNLANNLPSFDSNLAGTSLLTEFEVKIELSDFERAQKILEEKEADAIKQVDKSHYLFGFSNEELFDIILKKEEWSEFDYLLAKKILTERGKTIDEELVTSLRKQRIADLSKPEENQTPWIIAGYILALLGGAFGLITGYVLMSAKKTLPNGERVYSYTENDRKHGRFIFYLGIILMAFYIILRLLTSY